MKEKVKTTKISTISESIQEFIYGVIKLYADIESTDRSFNNKTKKKREREKIDIFERVLIIST